MSLYCDGATSALPWGRTPVARARASDSDEGGGRRGRPQGEARLRTPTQCMRGMWHQWAPGRWSARTAAAAAAQPHPASFLQVPCLSFFPRTTPRLPPPAGPSTTNRTFVLTPSSPPHLRPLTVASPPVQDGPGSAQYQGPTVVLWDRCVYAYTALYIF